jgi:hypothetical protein
MSMSLRELVAASRLSDEKPVCYKYEQATGRSAQNEYGA